MTLERGRTLRRNATETERRLWALLRNRRLAGLKFRRQVPIGPYIVDFLCADRRLIVELDGGQHVERAEQDRRRTEYLEAHGYFVVRFWNADMLKEPRDVQEELLGLIGFAPEPPPSKSRRRQA